MAVTNKRSWLGWVVLIVVAGAAVAGWRWYAGQAKDVAPEIKSAAVATGDITQFVTANGSLTPVRLVEVGSQISGVITKINVDYNSLVKSNDVVAQIDPATYQRALVQAEADQANSEAGLELAKLGYDRALALGVM